MSFCKKSRYSFFGTALKISRIFDWRLGIWDLSVGSAVNSFVINSMYVLIKGILKGILAVVKKEYISWFIE